MYACLYCPGNGALLMECAAEFSPHVEQTAADTVIFDVRGLESLYGPPEQLARVVVIGARRHLDAVTLARMFLIHAEQRHAMLDAKRVQRADEVPRRQSARHIACSTGRREAADRMLACDLGDDKVKTGRRHGRFGSLLALLNQR